MERKTITRTFLRMIAFRRTRKALNLLVSLLIISLFFSGCQYLDRLDDVVKDKDNKMPALSLFADGLTAPVSMAEAPDGSGNLFIVDQIGLIRVVTPDGTLQEEPFLDLQDRLVALREGYDERGLLGLAFHPDYASNGRFFVYYSAPLRPEAPGDWSHTSHLSEFRVSADQLRADQSSELVLMQVDQPQGNHNGGTLAFSPRDGYLYLSLGDGGGANDTGTGHVEDWYEENEGGNAQNITANLLGKIIRIDVDAGNPYGIPADNPFVGTEGLDEIYAYGFRNPYRFSFDMRGNNRLYAGDAGQELWEEVSIVEKGGNYGWNVKEGTHCFDAENPENPPADCPDTDGYGNPLIDPVIEFRNTKQGNGLGLVVVGGYVYWGMEQPTLKSQYLFGSWSSSFGSPDGRVFASRTRTASSGLWDFEEVLFSNTPNGKLNAYLLAFGQDAAGEVYVLTSGTSGPSGQSGKVYKIVSARQQMASLE